MQIAGENHWCEDCTAVEVLPANEPLIPLFLQALPAWDPEGYAGFDRAQVLALFRLRTIPEEDYAETWDAICELETEMRMILNAKQPETSRAR